ncbi:MAG: S8 family serine peptidase [Acidimicrobiales bacterium]
MKRIVAAAAAAALLSTAAAAPSGGAGRAGDDTPAALAAPQVVGVARPGAGPDGQVRLLVEPAAGRDGEVAEGLARMGITPRRVVADVIELDVAPDRVAEVAQAPGVAAVREQATMRETATVSEGRASIKAGDWNAQGFTGRGVRVGVIDSGFAEWDRAVAEGDAPPVDAAHRLNHCDRGFEFTAHGTASAELIYDVAPRVEFTLACIDDTLDLALAVDELLAAGVDIISMSLGFYNTSRGDGSGGRGTPDDSARKALAAGVTWVNAAGNEALHHWGGPFADADGDGVHEWTPGDEQMAVTIEPGGLVDVALRWDSWPVTSQDLDVCVASATRDLGCHGLPQTGASAPTESVRLTNPSGAPLEVFVSLAARSPLPPGLGLDVFFLGNAVIEHSTPANSLAEPASAPGVVAVGAACHATGSLEPFSSQGPTIDGRPGVSFVGPESVSGLVYGPASGCTGGYAGTSASAPYVAGALALLAQSHDRGSRHESVEELARITLANGDRGAPGLDPVWGYGMVTLGKPPVVGGSVLTRDGLEIATSATPDRADPLFLQGRTVAGEVYAFLTPVFAAGISRVTWRVDGRLVQVEKRAGYDLGGGMHDRSFPFDTTRYANGQHTVTALVEFADAPPQTVTAAFKINNTAPAPPRQLDVVLDGASLDGRTVAGPVEVSLAVALDAPAIERVEFWLDAELAGYDTEAPYQMGPVEGGATLPFDTGRLSPGEHMVQAIVFHADGALRTVNATFTVAEPHQM